MERWEALTLDEKHVLAQTMLEVVLITDDRVDVRFCI
jgi:hypothetical protein